MNYFRRNSPRKPIDIYQSLFLPDEILLHIFSYLSVQDKLVASLVCKQWLNVMNHPKLLENICVSFKVNSTKEIKNFFHMSRKFSCFDFIDSLIDDQCLTFFREFGCQITYLTFNGCFSNRKDMSTSSKSCSFTNLKVLKVFNCDLWSMFSSLPNLTELHLNHFTMLTDSSFAELGCTMPNLRALYLSANISFEPKVYRRFYPNSTSGNFLSTMILSFPAVEQFIAERARTLKTLSFSNTGISAPSLIKISQIPNLQLQKMVLSNCPECVNGLINLSQGQQQLKSLDLSYMYNLNDEAVQGICRLLPSIQEILITSCFIKNETVEKIFQLKNLETLKLSSCLKLSPDGFESAVSHFQSFNLKSLNLSFSRIQSVSIIKLLKQCKYLVYLDLSFCDVTDEVISIISCSLAHLEYLKLTGCKKITDAGLTGNPLDAFFNREEELSSPIEYELKPLSNMKWLKKLNLSGCLKITDAGVINGIKFHGLQYLNLSKCDNVTSNAVTLLTKQNPSLMKIVWKDENPFLSF